MKCDKCEFQRCESNESYTEYYCELFGEDVPEEFATYDGCNLMLKEAKKLSELFNDVGQYFDSIYGYYVTREELTEEQQAEIYRRKKEYDLAKKNLKDYKDILLSRRKKK